MSNQLDVGLRHLAIAVGEELSDRVLDAMEKRIEAAVTRALATRQDNVLRPLHQIIPDLDVDAARMRVNRDPELAKLGVVVSEHVVAKGKRAGQRVKRLEFRPAEVLAYYAAKTRGGR